MTPAIRGLVEGAFVTARVGAHRIAVEAAHVAEVLAPGVEVPGTITEVESVLGIEKPAPGDRICLRLRRARQEAALEVPGPHLQIGRRLRGRCQRPELVAAALERCCLAGVIQDEEGFFYLLDVARFWTRFVDPASSKGESS